MDQGQAELDCDRREACWGSSIRGAEDDDQEEERHHHLAYEPGSERIAAWGVRAEAVRGEAAGRAETGGAARDEVEDSCAHDGARHLRDHIRAQVTAGKRFPTSSPTDTAGLRWQPDTWPMAYA